MAITVPLLSANSTFALYPESVYGTTAAASVWTPVNSPKVTPGVKWLEDSDFRGSPVKIYDEVQGVFAAQYDAKTYVYADVYPHFLRGTLGSTDTVASVGPSLYSHTIGLINSPNLGSQSPSYTIYNNSVDSLYEMVASRIDSLDISLAADAACENSFSYKCNQPTQNASVASVPETSQHLIPAWNCSASIGGAAVTVVESVDINIKRGTTQIYTLGSQSAASNFQGPIEVTGKFTLVVQQGETYWANALVRDQQAVSLTLTDPLSSYSVLYQMSTCQLMNPIINQGKNYVELDCDFTAVANSTDAVNVGLSPIKTVTVNGTINPY